MLADLNPAKDEENAKKRIGSFLEKVLPGYDFNNRSKRDFVMRRGQATTDAVGVIFEMKHLDEKKYMGTCSTGTTSTGCFGATWGSQLKHYRPLRQVNRREAQRRLL